MFEGWLQIAIFVAVLVALIKPVGIYMSRVFTNQRVFLSPVVGPIERITYKVLRVKPEAEGQDWKAYARSVAVARARPSSGNVLSPSRFSRPGGRSPPCSYA